MIIAVRAIASIFAHLVIYFWLALRLTGDDLPDAYTITDMSFYIATAAVFCFWIGFLCRGEMTDGGEG